MYVAHARYKDMKVLCQTAVVDITVRFLGVSRVVIWFTPKP